jgi:outer membrane protein assembly factor BamB
MSIAICRMIFLTVALATATCMAADWPTFRGNPQRTGYYPDPAGYPQDKTLLLHLPSVPFVSSPSVVSGILYIGARDSTLYAVDATNGNVVWKKKTAGWVDSSPLLFDDNVVVGSRDATVYMLDSRSGAQVSLLEGGIQLSSPAVLASGVIITGLGPPFAGVSGYIRGLEKRSKAQRVQAAWSLSLPQMSYSSAATYGQFAAIGADDGRLYGLDGQEGRIVWSLPTGGGVYLSTPAIDTRELAVYFAPGEEDYSVYAVRLTDGKLLWQSEGAPARALSKRLRASPISYSRMESLLRLSPKDRRQALGKTQGKLSALADADSWIATGGAKTSSVAVDDRNVYVVQKALGLLQTNDTQGTGLSYMPRFTLLALDKKTGSEKWRFSELANCVRVGYSSSPVVTDHIIFAGWGGGMLHAVDKESGKCMWSDTLAGDIISSPAIAGGRLYVATMNGYLYSYNLAATAPGLDFQRSTYCYPNPARGTVSHVQVYVSRSATVDITVYNSADKAVVTISRPYSAGEKSPCDWDISHVANGVYFALVKVKYADGTSEKKVLKVAVLH